MTEKKHKGGGKRTVGLATIGGGLLIGAGVIGTLAQAYNGARFYGGGFTGLAKALSPWQQAGGAPSNSGILGSEFAKTMAPAAFGGLGGVALIYAANAVPAAAKRAELRIGKLRLGA